ncbi:MULTISPECIES: dipeptidase [Chitinophagaceae]
MFIIDGHLDLSMNAMEWNRDLTQPLSTIRKREEDLTDKPDRGNSVISFEELRNGNIGIVLATQLARCTDQNGKLTGSGWFSPEQAWAQTQGQLAWYRAMEQKGEMKMIRTKTDLQNNFQLWNDGKPNNNKPIGYVLSLEGADSLVDLSYVDVAYSYGLRAIGPGHYGPGRYANGTDATGHLNEKGKELLRKMQQLGMALDATHLNDDAFWDAMELFDGVVWASHNHCRKIVNHNRQFSDAMIKALIEKDAIIGAAFDAWMIVPNWVRSVSQPKEMGCSIDSVVKHIDYICQIAGNSNHVCIGSDLDGGFGKEQCPYDLETIADLQKVSELFAKRGYTNSDIENLMYKNWMRALTKSLPF